MREITIGQTTITEASPCYLVAEVGNNHQGRVATAIELTRMAHSLGASAVKFQKRHNATLYTRELLDKPYDGPTSFGTTYGAHRDALELQAEELVTVQRAVPQTVVFATVFDERSVDDLEQTLDPPAYKLASGALMDADLQAYVASFDKPILLSTGGGTLADIDRAITRIDRAGCPVAVLHCTASYPCLPAELNLRCITTLRQRYPDRVIGWSGHDNGIAMAIAAYTLGAQIIEKHFTMDRTWKGTDHAFSLEPAGLRKLARDLERTWLALGDGEKRWYPSEVAPIAKMRRTWTPEGWKITGSRPSWDAPPSSPEAPTDG